MVYILNTNLKNEKKVHVALKQIYGIGKTLSYQICDQLGFSPSVKLNQLTESQIEQISQLINQNYHIGGELKQDTIKNVQRLVRIANYRGFRHNQALPLRGQRTHTNARTTRRVKLFRF